MTQAMRQKDWRAEPRWHRFDLYWSGSRRPAAAVLSELAAQ
jgi:hypothetical protein